MEVETIIMNKKIPKKKRILANVNLFYFNREKEDISGVEIEDIFNLLWKGEKNSIS